MDLHAIQQALKKNRMDGWLFYDFHNRDPIAYRILGLDFGKFTSRRWFYYIPALGEPVRLVHRVEPAKLDRLPGDKRYYLSWRELHTLLSELPGKTHARIAMQYSPNQNIPAVSTADAGLVDLIRSLGHEVVSSADMVQQFEAVLDEAGLESHLEAMKRIQQIKTEAFREIEKALRQGLAVTEYDIQQFIVRRYDDLDMDAMNEFPIVGVNEHPANPHFEPTPENTVVIQKGDTILIDLWAKLKKKGSVFADITWCGFAGKNPPAEYTHIFHLVRDARKAGVDFIRRKFEKHEICRGWEVDDVVRSSIAEGGYGDHFIHRTGHSIGEEVHGNGVNIDNLETREERSLIPGICFSIEPGIYIEGKMAARSEINVFITPGGEVVAGGDQQEELILLDV